MNNQLWTEAVEARRAETQAAWDARVSSKTVMVKIWGSMYPAYADDSGVVRVHDPVAGHYTTCHRLSNGVQARVRRETGRAGE